MHIKASQFQTLADTLLGANAKLSPKHAEAIVGVARLAVDSDLQEDDDELAAYDDLAARVCALAGVSADGFQANEAIARRGDDDRAERMRVRAEELDTPATRELAYVVAYVLTIADLQIAPSEDNFLADLGVALKLDDDRIDALGELVSDALSPAET